MRATWQARHVDHAHRRSSSAYAASASICQSGGGAQSILAASPIDGQIF